METPDAGFEPIEDKLKSRLLDLDFSDEAEVAKLREVFSGDIFAEQTDTDRTFVSFLQRLQKVISSEKSDAWETCLLARKKIKEGRRLNTHEVETLQDLGLRHWKGANLKGHRMRGIDGADLRADIQHVEFIGDLEDVVADNVDDVLVKGDVNGLKANRINRVGIKGSAANLEVGKVYDVQVDKNINNLTVSKDIGHSAEGSIDGLSVGNDPESRKLAEGNVTNVHADGHIDSVEASGDVKNMHADGFVSDVVIGRDRENVTAGEGDEFESGGLENVETKGRNLDNPLRNIFKKAS